MCAPVVCYRGREEGGEGVGASAAFVCVMMMMRHSCSMLACARVHLSTTDAGKKAMQAHTYKHALLPPVCHGLCAWRVRGLTQGHEDKLGLLRAVGVETADLADLDAGLQKQAMLSFHHTFSIF